MDHVPETPIQIKEQGTPKEGIPIPQEISRALGRGLNQSLNQQFQQIRSAMSKMSKLKGTKEIDLIEKGLQKIESTLKRLEDDEETRLVEPNKGNGDPGEHFEYSGKIAKEKPKAGEIRTDELTQPIVSALSHVLKNPLTSVQGFSEIVEKQNGNEEVAKSARLINEASLEIEKKLVALDDVENIKLITDNNGKTSIFPIHPAKT